MVQWQYLSHAAASCLRRILDLKEALPMIFAIDDAVFQFAAFRLEGWPGALANAAFAILVGALFWAASRLLKFVVLPRLEKALEGSRFRVMQILLHGFAPSLPVSVWLGGLCIGVSILPWAAAYLSPMRRLALLAFRLGCIVLLSRGLWNSSPLCRLLLGSAAARLDFKTNRTLYAVLEKCYQLVVIAFCSITVLDELGYPVTSLITGFGLVGLTVSLAAQDSASNLFSGMMILLERPFVIGDWIKVGDVEGTVEDLSFRSTKIRALDNSLYVLPNSSVSSATINNGTSRTKRMFRFTLGVTYDTPREKIEFLMTELEKMLRARDDTETDSVTVRLTGFGASSIDILVHCYILTPDNGKFLAIQNSINLDILSLMNDNGIGFAFPSTSVYIEKAPAEKDPA